MISPQYLYKYRPFGELLLKELCEQEVYYCQPQKFNDPLDCKPLLSNDIDLKKLEKFAYQILKRKQTDDPKWAVSEMNNFRYNATEFGEHNDGKEGEREYTRSLLRVVEDDLREAIGDIGVLSLSRRWNSMLMWSHYAANHKGVCLEFEVADNRCRDLQPVTYGKPRGVSVTDLFRWRLQGDADAERRVRYGVIFAKAIDWKYEAEWRAIQSPPGRAPSPFRLRSILFGARCETSVITTLVKLLSGSEVNPRFFEIYLDNERTKLRRMTVDTDFFGAFGVRRSSTFREEELLEKFYDVSVCEEDVPNIQPTADGKV